MPVVASACDFCEEGIMTNTCATCSDVMCNQCNDEQQCHGEVCERWVCEECADCCEQCEGWYCPACALNEFTPLAQFCGECNEDMHDQNAVLIRERHVRLAQLLARRST